MTGSEKVGTGSSAAEGGERVFVDILQIEDELLKEDPLFSDKRLLRFAPGAFKMAYRYDQRCVMGQGSLLQYESVEKLLADMEQMDLRPLLHYMYEIDRPRPATIELVHVRQAGPEFRCSVSPSSFSTHGRSSGSSGQLI